MAADEKTEKATPKRRQDERKKGNVFQSHDAVAVLSLLVGINALKLLSPFMYEYIFKSMNTFFDYARETSVLTAENIGPIMLRAVMLFMITALPILLVCAAAAVVLTIVQTRMLFSMKAIHFKANRISPLAGLKRLFSVRSMIEVLKAIIKIIVLGLMLYQVISDRLIQFPRLMDGTVMGAVAYVGDTVVSLVNTTCMIFCFLAGFDYLYQWWDYEKNLRMTKQEIKDEYKQTEGDPQVKGKIKEKQQQMAGMRMMQKVPDADVIIRNPTHFAIALGYDADHHTAPVVLAKGADLIALKIVEIGEANDIYIIENKPLARGLYDAVDVDMEIPAQFYQAVAEILAYAYKVKEKTL